MDAVVETLTDRLVALYEASTPAEQEVLDAFLTMVSNNGEAEVEGFILNGLSAFSQAQTLSSTVQNKLRQASRRL